MKKLLALLISGMFVASAYAQTSTTAPAAKTESKEAVSAVEKKPVAKKDEVKAKKAKSKAKKAKSKKAADKSSDAKAKSTKKEAGKDKKDETAKPANGAKGSEASK